MPLCQEVQNGMPYPDGGFWFSDGHRYRKTSAGYRLGYIPQAIEGKRDIGFV